MTSSAYTYPVHLSLPSMIFIAILLWVRELGSKHRGTPLLSMPHDSWQGIFWEKCSDPSFLFSHSSKQKRDLSSDLGTMKYASYSLPTDEALSGFFSWLLKTLMVKTSLRLGVWFRKASPIWSNKVGDIRKPLCSPPQHVLQYNFFLLIKLAFWFTTDFWIYLLKILSHVEHKRMDMNVICYCPWKTVRR